MRLYLENLPLNHKLRNCSLVGAFYHSRNGKFSREVLPTYGIAKSIYNNLSESWTNSESFYFNVCPICYDIHSTEICPIITGVK